MTRIIPSLAADAPLTALTARRPGSRVRLVSNQVGPDPAGRAVLHAAGVGTSQLTIVTDDTGTGTPPARRPALAVEPPAQSPCPGIDADSASFFGIATHLRPLTCLVNRITVMMKIIVNRSNKHLRQRLWDPCCARRRPFRQSGWRSAPTAAKMALDPPAIRIGAARAAGPQGAQAVRGQAADRAP